MVFAGNQARYCFLTAARVARDALSVVTVCMLPWRPSLMNR